MKGLFIMTLSQGKSSLLTVVMLASMINPAQASVLGAPLDGAKFAYNNPKLAALTAASLAFGHSLFLFFKRVPDREPNRYDLNKVYDADLLKNNPKAYFENLKYLYLDGWIGHTYKSSSLKADLESGEIEIKGLSTIQNRGFYGWVHSRTKALMPTCRFGLRATAVFLLFVFGWEFTTTFATYLNEGHDVDEAFTKAFEAMQAKGQKTYEDQLKLDQDKRTTVAVMVNADQASDVANKLMYKGVSA